MRPFLSEEQFKLYDLIWKRAVASQATPAEFDQTTVDIEAGRLGLRYGTRSAQVESRFRSMDCSNEPA